MSEPVRVRIAPSPTGVIHLGLVRTALYNWLFARHHGGRFILRIDDTDQQRNSEDVLRPLYEGLRWLGIDWDEGPFVGGPHEPYFQSQRTARYRAAVDRLLVCGAAYWDYATPDEIDAERKHAIDSKQGVFRYSRRWMAETAEDRLRLESEGRKCTVRLKMPTQGTLPLDDVVRGRVDFDWAREQDHVIMRADGTFLYHLASTVDDMQMEISHVIRAEEHLSNTPRQVFIIQSLGGRVPVYAHLPFVAEPGSKNKLSKRKIKQYLKNRDFADLVARGDRIARALGLEFNPEFFNPVVTEFYERIGFLPEVLVNYVALLGWSLDDSTEEFTREELVRSFTLDRVNRAPASFDSGKLMAFQVRRMLALPVAERARLCLPFLVQAGVVTADSPGVEERTASIIAAAGDRVKVAGDILDYTDFFVPEEQLPYDDSAFRKVLADPAAQALLEKLGGRLSTQEAFSPAALESLLQQFVADEGNTVGQVVRVLRVALTGKAVGFGLYDTMAILGRQSVLARINQALARAKGEK
jgi:glutamyl-tRNA synthetase